MRLAASGLALLALCAGAEAAAGDPPATAGWPVTEGTPGGWRYSPLADIRPENVARLEVVWTHRHGDVRSPWIPMDESSSGTSFEATPILVDGRLVFPTPMNRVIALDAETGTELWSFDPEIDSWRMHPNMMISRGVAHWRDPRAAGPCASRIFLGTLDARLIALDAETGKPCAGFGEQGTVDLRVGIERIVDPYEYAVTSPPTVVGDLVVVGSAIADVIRRIQPDGAVRAFDARTGTLVWRFDPVPRAADEAGAETWEDESWRQHGGANVWSTMTTDPERGLLFLPVSTAGPDFYGGDRPGANLFTDSVVALDTRTGRRVWHFQTVHHDLWDYDLPAPPSLVRVRRDGHAVDAVALLTKTGLVFLLARESGEPLFPVEERPVPQSDVPGERTWPTQPFPARPPPLVPHRFGEQDLWDADPAHLETCRQRLRALRNEGIYTPPSERGSTIHPFTGGGANWPGSSFDPETGWLYVPVLNQVHTIQLTKLADANFDDSDGVVVNLGLGSLWWLLTGRGTGLRYFMDRRLFEHDGRPCLAPPWGWLVAVDLEAGEIRWKVPTGEMHGVVGLTSLGPPLLTGGGILLHSGTADQVLRAHDARTGDVLARFPLPAGAHGGPITYKLRPGGRQYVVVAAGGHGRLHSKLGDYVIAYALPGEPEQPEPGGASH
jgi:quinoprotein glucose dehydrogenase